MVATIVDRYRKAKKTVVEEKKKEEQLRIQLFRERRGMTRRAVQNLMDRRDEMETEGALPYGREYRSHKRHFQRDCLWRKPSPSTLCTPPSPSSLFSSFFLNVLDLQHQRYFSLLGMCILLLGLRHQEEHECSVLCVCSHDGCQANYIEHNLYLLGAKVVKARNNYLQWRFRFAFVSILDLMCMRLMHAIQVYVCMV